MLPGTLPQIIKSPCQLRSAGNIAVGCRFLFRSTGPKQPIPSASIPYPEICYHFGTVLSGVSVGNTALSKIFPCSSPMAHTIFVPPASIPPNFILTSSQYNFYYACSLFRIRLWNTSTNNRVKSIIAAGMIRKLLPYPVFQQCLRKYS